MKVIAKSSFDSRETITFIKIKEGWNLRKIRAKCSCGCGFPTTRTKWELPTGCVIGDVYECSPDNDYGHGYIRFYVISTER